MRCEELLARYSEYLDGALLPADCERVRAHLANCPRCQRYDQVYRRGVKLLSNAPQPEPAPDFFEQLQYRLAAEDGRSFQPISTTVAAAVSIAAVLALLVWVPTAFLSRTNAEPLAIAAALDSTTNEVAWHGGEAIVEETPHEENHEPETWLTPTSAAVSLIDRGYNPIVLESPTEPPAYARVTLTSLETR